MAIKKSYNESYYTVKLDGLNTELEDLHKTRAERRLQTDLILQHSEDVIDSQQTNPAYIRSRTALNETKKKFVRELNAQDPQWKEKV